MSPDGRRIRASEDGVGQLYGGGWAFEARTELWLRLEELNRRLALCGHPAVTVELIAVFGKLRGECLVQRAVA
jgi:hypothetical protein